MLFLKICITFSFYSMRIKFVETESRYKAKKQCPWASKTMKVFGGYLCFESISDYIIAKNQK